MEEGRDEEGKSKRKETLSGEVKLQNLYCMNPVMKGEKKELCISLFLTKGWTPQLSGDMLHHIFVWRAEYEFDK